MDKKQYKEKVLKWLAENNIFPKKVRVYNTRRYGLEVRIYQKPQEFKNSKRSTRKKPEWTDEKGNTWNAMSGVFSQKISLYTHINEQDLKSEAEKEFILEILKVVDSSIDKKSTHTL